MKLLFLGYRPYLPEILLSLHNTQFLQQNEIDILIAKPNINLHKKFEHLNSYYAQYLPLAEQIFPEINLTFLTDYQNIRRLEYWGLENIKNLGHYDLMIVASYAQKIPRSIFTQPKYGTINIHPSLLPDLRGGYPTYIQAYDNTAMRGTSIHVMTEGWDEGDVISLLPNENNNHLTNAELLSISARQAAQLLNQLHDESFDVTPKPQNEALVTYCHKILKRQHLVDDMPSAEAFEGFVRANYDRYLFPYTYTFYQNSLFIILAVQAVRLDDIGIEALPSRHIFNQAGTYYLKFDHRIYQITEYIYRNQYHRLH